MKRRRLLQLLAAAVFALWQKRLRAAVLGPPIRLTLLPLGGSAITPTVLTPSFSPVAGTYTGTQTVAISCGTPGAAIYYTIDGSTPTYPITGSTQLYSGTFGVPSSETVSAIGVLAGYNTSAVGSAAYTINTGGGALVFPLKAAYHTDFNHSVAAYNYNYPAWQSGAAQFDLVYFQSDSQEPFSNQGAGTTLAQFFSNIKGIAPGIGNPNIKLGFYGIDEESSETPGSHGEDEDSTDKINELNSNLGWRVQTSGYPTTSNPTPGVTPNNYQNNTCTSGGCPTHTLANVGSSGITPGTVTAAQFMAWYDYQKCVNGKFGLAANSYVDFFHRDNWFMGPRHSACWLSTSTVYSAGSLADLTTILSAYQGGYADANACLLRRAAAGPFMQAPSRGARCENPTRRSAPSHPMIVRTSEVPFLSISSHGQR